MNRIGPAAGQSQTYSGKSSLLSHYVAVFPNSTQGDSRTQRLTDDEQRDANFARGLRMGSDLLVAAWNTLSKVLLANELARPRTPFSGRLASLEDWSMGMRSTSAKACFSLSCLIGRYTVTYLHSSNHHTSMWQRDCIHGTGLLSRMESMTRDCDMASQGLRFRV